MGRKRNLEPASLALPTYLWLEEAMVGTLKVDLLFDLFDDGLDGDLGVSVRRFTKQNLRPLRNASPWSLQLTESELSD